MSETIASVNGPEGGYEQVKYSNGSQHVYETQTNPSNGEVKKIHVSSDEMVKAFGHEPGPVPADLTPPPNLLEQNTDNTEVDALREQVTKLTEAVSNLTEKVGQILEQNSKLTEQNAELIKLLTNQNKPQEPEAQAVSDSAQDSVEDPQEEPVDEAMERMENHFSMLDGGDETEEGVEETEGTAQAEEGGRLQRAWNRITDVASGRTTLAQFNSRAAEEEPTDEPQEQRRRRRGGLLVAGLALAGAGVAAYYLTRHGIPFIGGNGRHSVEQMNHVNLSGINPDTVHATNPTQFQHGVLHLLDRQGLHAHGVTPEKIKHMNEWMSTHNIASGMKSGPHGLEQNLGHFPTGGHEFSNAHASADQGFQIGKSGTGRENLHKWIRHAEKIGITFSRDNKAA